LPRQAAELRRDTGYSGARRNSAIIADARGVAARITT